MRCKCGALCTNPLQPEDPIGMRLVSPCFAAHPIPRLQKRSAIATSTAADVKILQGRDCLHCHRQAKQVFSPAIKEKRTTISRRAAVSYKGGKSKYSPRCRPYLSLGLWSLAKLPHSVLQSRELHPSVFAVLTQQRPTLRWVSKARLCAIFQV